MIGFDLGKETTKSCISFSTIIAVAASVYKKGWQKNEFCVDDCVIEVSLRLVGEVRCVGFSDNGKTEWVQPLSVILLLKGKGKNTRYLKKISPSLI